MHTLISLYKHPAAKVGKKTNKKHYNYHFPLRKPDPSSATRLPRRPKVPQLVCPSRVAVMEISLVQTGGGDANSVGVRVRWG